MAAWFLRTDNRTETTWFDPEPQPSMAVSIEDVLTFHGRSRPATWSRRSRRQPGSTEAIIEGPHGTLATAVFGSLANGQGANDRTRAKQLLSRRVVRAVHWPKFDRDAAAIRRQLHEWFTTGQIGWNPIYEGLEENDRPATEIPAVLVNEIHWRGPHDLAIDSLGAALLASVVTGALTQTLFGCVSCRRLFTRNRGRPRKDWRQRCVACRLAWTSRRPSGRLQAGIRRVLDRARKLKIRNLDQEYQLRKECDRIVADVKKGRLSAASALRDMAVLLPRKGRLGRPRKII